MVLFHRAFCLEYVFEITERLFLTERLILQGFSQGLDGFFAFNVSLLGCKLHSLHGGLHRLTLAILELGSVCMLNDHMGRHEIFLEWIALCLCGQTSRGKAK